MSYANGEQYERVRGSIGYTNSILGLIREDTTSYTRDAREMLLSERLSTGTYYYLYDGVGSTVALVDGAGIVNAYSYERYGKLVTSTGTVANPWRVHGCHERQLRRRLGSLQVRRAIRRSGSRSKDADRSRRSRR
jgi:hypothetical protein